MEADRIDRFLSQNIIQFQTIGLPVNLHREASKKILSEEFDAGHLVMFGIMDASDNDDDDNDEGSTHSVATDESSLQQTINFPDESSNEGERVDHSTRPYSLYSKISMKSSSCVLLIDHMCATTFPEARKLLESHPSLRDRLKSALGLESDDINVIWNQIWPCVMPLDYDDNEYSKWFLMDEVGLAMQHSNRPNFACKKISVQLPNQQEPWTLSLAWPIEDIDEGDIITRDFLADVTPDRLTRQLRLLAFETDVSPDYINKVVEAAKNPILDSYSASVTGSASLEFDAFQGVTPVIDSWLPALQHLSQVSAGIQQSNERPLRIFCDRKDHLNSELITTAAITIVDNPVDADVLYLIDHTIGHGDQLHEYEKSGKIMNQFWWEGMIVSKEQLSKTVKQAFDGYRPLRQRITSQDSEHGDLVDDDRWPAWYPKSFDLSEPIDLLAFINSFLIQQKKRNMIGDQLAEVDVDNLWIIKKYRGKQSIDYPITSNLSCALRHHETSARLACKYIRNPALLSGKKFDLRYFVLVHSLEPLVLYRHEFFVVRWANLEYSSSGFEEYQKHFTVMNFLDDVELSHVRGQGTRQNITAEDFVKLFDSEQQQQGRAVTWEKDVQPRVNDTIRQVFEAVRSALHLQEEYTMDGKLEPLHPNSAWSINQRNVTPARAMYGFDILVDDTFQPQVLEVQWGPDCAKAIEFRPTFWNEILSALFLDKYDHIVRL